MGGVAKLAGMGEDGEDDTEGDEDMEVKSGGNWRMLEGISTVFGGHDRCLESVCIIII